MRPKTLLVLFALVVALGAFIWFYERELPGSDERAVLQKRVLDVEPEEVTELEIARGGEVVRMTRAVAAEPQAEATDDPSRARREWQLHQPFETRADGPAADQLVADLSALEKERELEDVDLAAVGLEVPRASVTLRTPEGERVLRIGSEVPASSNMVVELDGNVLVVAASLWGLLDKEGGEWRSRDLLPSHRGAVEKIELNSEVASWSLVRRGENDFWLELPVEDLAGKESVDELLTALFDFEAKSFLDTPELSTSEMGLEPAAVRLAVEFVDRDEPVLLELGNPIEGADQERYARAEGRLVAVGNELDEMLSRAPADWQSTDWTALEVFEINSFRAADAEGELLLERAGSNWQRNGIEISYTPVSDFLYALTGTAAERIVGRDEAASLGVDLNVGSLSLALQTSEAEETLELYDAGSGAVASREGRSQLLLLTEGTVEDLRLKLEAIRDEPEVAEEEPAEVDG